MELRETFTRFVEENGLFSSEQPVLLAVSGGLDSVVMTHLFSKCGFKFGIAHCNFQLRGEESDGDEAFVRQLAETCGVPFFVRKFETAEYSIQRGVSIQMAARELRYGWFQELAVEHHYSFLATAHHLNDSVETALLNFIRGTGLSGLSGIRLKWQFPVDEPVWLVRPLLFASREHIHGYARVCGLAWREDSSNADDHYDRNYVRHHVMPGMTALNPSFLSTAGRNLRRTGEARDNLAFLTRQFLGIPHEIPVAGLAIEIARLRQLPSPRQALAVVLKPLDFDQEQIRQIAKNLALTGFMLQSKSGWRVMCDRGRLHLMAKETTSGAESEIGEETKIFENDLMLRLPGGGSLLFMPVAADAAFPDGLQAIAVDRMRLVYPLVVRPWMPGDSFLPFGMHGKRQKLQDYFTNNKLSRKEKEEARLLVNGDGAIIWVMGKRMDERFRVTPDCKTAVKILLQPAS